MSHIRSIHVENSSRKEVTVLVSWNVTASMAESSRGMSGAPWASMATEVV